MADWPPVFVPALVASTAGSLIGAVLLEEAARHGGRPFADRFLRFTRQDPAKLDDAELWFRRRGACRRHPRPLALPALVLTVIAAAGLVLWRSLRRRRSGSPSDRV